MTLDAPDDPNTYHYQLFAVNGLPIPSRIRECTSMTLARSLIQTADLAALFSTESLELDYIKNEFAVVPLLDNIPDSVISVVRPKRKARWSCLSEYCRTCAISIPSFNSDGRVARPCEIKKGQRMPALLLCVIHCFFIIN